MKFQFYHYNFNVMDLEKSITFYRENLGLHEVKRKVDKEGRFIIVYLGDSNDFFRLELTWLRDWKEPYNLGDNEMHLAFKVDDYHNAYVFHKKQGCICYENPVMGIYFIEDPDGYWLEIVPSRE